ncbi:MAG: cyclically-permuted mutarotase family protein [Spirochaetia bacterium]
MNPISLLSLSMSSIGTVGGRNIVDWHDAIEFPLQHGLAQPLGVAGAFAGFLGHYLIVAGGSNFPRGSSVHGGQKEFSDDLFVFQSKNGSLTQVAHKLLPQKFAAGLTVGTADGLFFVGGENLADDCADIWYLTLSGKTPNIQKVGALPFTWVGGSGALYGGRLYLFGGKVDGLPSQQCFVCNLDGSHCQEIAPFPQVARVQTLHAVCADKIYIFHGFSQGIAQTDGYVYDFTKDSWDTLPSLWHQGQVYTVAGGTAVAISAEEILLFGGVNKEVFEQASHELTHLKDQAFQSFREKYLAQNPQDFKFNNHFFIYNIRTKMFTHLQQAPFLGLAGCFPLLFHDGTIWVVSGEIKPEVRMPLIKVGKLE